MPRTRKTVGYALIAPAFVSLFLMTIYPLAYVVFVSLHHWAIVPLIPRVFVGFQQYISLFRDSGFYQSVSATLVYTCAAVAAEMLLGFLLAWLIAKTRMLWIRLLYLLPAVTTPVVVGLIWRFFLAYNLGPINYFLSSVGLGRVNWLGGSTAALMSIILVDIWQWTPFTLLIFLSGLEKSIWHLHIHFLPITCFRLTSPAGCGSWIKIISPIIFSFSILCLVMSLKRL